MIFNKVFNLAFVNVIVFTGRLEVAWCVLFLKVGTYNIHAVFKSPQNLKANVVIVL